MKVRSLIPSFAKEIARNALRSRSDRADWVRHDYLGHELFMDVHDGTARRWYARDWTEGERREFAELAKCGIPANGTAFNLGAHHGLIAMLIRKRLVPQGRVVAVEINRPNSRICLRNIEKNGIPGIECLNAAVSEDDAAVQFLAHSNSGIDANPSALKSAAGMTIDGITVDELCRRYGMPALIYMDIEGAEVLALRGAGEALRQVQAWFVELHGDEACARYGGRNAEIASAMLDNGYRLSLAVAESDDFRPIDSVDQIPSGRCHIIACRPT